MLILLEVVSTGYFTRHMIFGHKILNELLLCMSHVIVWSDCHIVMCVAHCHHPSNSSAQVVAPDIVLNCPRASVRRPSEPSMVGHYGGVIRPHLPGLHSVIAPVRSTTGELLISCCNDTDVINYKCKATDITSRATQVAILRFLSPHRRTPSLDLS